MTVDSTSSSTAILSWTPLPGNQGYRIIYTNTGPDGVERTVSSGTNSITLSGLSAGAFYDVRVEAITSTGTTVVVGTTLVNTGIPTWQLRYLYGYG